MDRILKGFLERQYEQGMALARQSDLLRLTPLNGPVPQHYGAEFFCKGLVRHQNGRIVEAQHFAVGISFPDDYLRRVTVPGVLSWVGPVWAWHPNIRFPHICPGHLSPGTELVDLLYQIFEIITYFKVTPRENDALNRDACAWARNNMGRFPLDRRPLKRPAKGQPSQPVPQAALPGKQAC